MLIQSVLWRALRQCRVRKLAGAFVATALASALFPHGALAADPDPKTWGGIGWGIGVAADFDLGGRRVTKAVAVNNIVRVDTSGDVALGFVLEAHYFFRDWPGSDRVRNWVGSCGGRICTDVAIGPFVAVEINGGKTDSSAAGPITGYALGAMVGLRHLNADGKPTTPNSSWNFGIGLRVDPQAKVLGDGIVANQPLPPGETGTDVRLKTTPRYGLMLLSSFSF